MKTENLQSYIHTFIAAYGESALREAMQQYIDDRQIYICRAKSHIARIPIRDICYLEIAQHNITIHTTHEVYKKYGTLNQELKILSPFGFIKCNQSCVVSLNKIKIIQNNNIILIDNTVLNSSRTYAPKVLTAFSRKIYSGNFACSAGPK